MSDKPTVATYNLGMHGRVICKECGVVIITCRCMKCAENIKYDVCAKCNAELRRKAGEK